MKKILLITASMRQKGNSKALIDLCEKYLKTKEEYTVKSINLYDYEIKDCTGCMKCAVSKEFCRTRDDLRKILDEITACDVLFIASPTYYMGAPAKIKAINDRLLYAHNLVSYADKKPAGVIVTSGRQGWEGFTIQNVSIFLLSLGFYVKDTLHSFAQGPSQVLLIPEIEEKVKNLTDKVLSPEYKIPTLSEKCPLCHGKSYMLLGEGRVKCEVCDLEGKIYSQKDGQTLILFSIDDINNSRWAENNIKSHMQDWVEASGSRYREKVRDIMKLRQKLFNE